MFWMKKKFWVRLRVGITIEGKGYGKRFRIGVMFWVRDRDYMSDYGRFGVFLDAIEDQMDQGGNVVDYHGSDFFPERWFDAVFVLRTDNTTLYDRLMARGYMGRKLTENIECEIFGTLAEEARDAYPSLNVQELNSKTMDDFNANLDLLTAFVNEFRAAKQQK